VQHKKLANQKEAAQKKAFWGEALEKLKEMLCK